jgi:hypothetical protein
MASRVKQVAIMVPFNLNFILFVNPNVLAKKRFNDF